MGVLLVLTVSIFRQQLFDHWTFPWDFVGGYSATPAFVAASIGRGNFLSWSPFVASGFPVDIDPQSGLYFPGWWILGALHVPLTLRAVTTVQIVHVLFGSFGVLALARARKLDWLWATVAAVAYLFFGGFYGEAEHADIFRGFSYLPWLLWAFTPPEDCGRWLRMATVPPLAWLIASGAYPGQIVSFAIIALVYLSIAVWMGGREIWARYRVALGLAVVSAGATYLAVLLPYLRAEHANELIRVMEPTAVVRAGASISLQVLFGFYLNNFAWTYDGTVTALAVGAPILLGVACVKLVTLRRHAPLIACGVAALALAMSPKIGPIGKAMVAVRPLFPSRFPAADYKAVVAVTLIIVSADSWSEIASRTRSFPWKTITTGCVLLAGALLAPTTYGQPTYRLWLLVAVLIACIGLSAARPSPRVMASLLVGLVVVDGAREIADYRLVGHISPWRASPIDAAPYRARDAYIRKLPRLLERAPASRPSRVSPYASLEQMPTGSDPDASGWVADGYHLIDYGGTIERVLWQAEHNPDWSTLLLAPWHGYTFPCAAVGCGNGRVRLPPVSTWAPSPDVRTISYGAKGIVYSVAARRPVLMVENELALRGWHTDSKQVNVIDAGIPLRAWRLSAGRYHFTATFQESGRTLQELVVIAALVTWLSCFLVLRQRRGFARHRRFA
jgi:hypothetical protein